MNFEDPFANDLNNFRSVAAGLRHNATSSPAVSSLGRSLGGGAASLASPVFASPSTRSQLDTASAGQGLGSPLFGSGTSEAVSLFPSAASGAPVAGRRARATPSAVSPLSAAPSSVSPSLQSAARAPLGPAAMTPQPTAAPSALSWLDEVDTAAASPQPAAASRRQGPPPLSPPPHSSVAIAAPGHGGMPAFLNFDGGDASAVAAPLPSAPGAGQAHSDGNSISVARDTAAAAAAAEEERKKGELRELYATLMSLDMELQRLDDRLDTRQLKEETELLALETSAMSKANELADKEEELAAKRAELTQHTAVRLEALHSRYTREMEAQAAEVRSLDGVRFDRQLQQLRGQCDSVEEAVKGLRERAALAAALEPFSEQGVRVALAAATADAASSSSSSAHGAAPSENAKGGDSAPSPSSVGSPAVEAGLHKAVDLLRAYCDQRLAYARDHLVDHVHNETLAAAHDVRRTREQQWADDALQHKSRFNQYMTDMMERYMVFYKERAMLKQQNISSLQKELQSTAAELRATAAARLQELLKSVTAKMTLSAEQQGRSAEEAQRVLHKKASTVLEGDVAVAMTQRKTLETRLLTEAQARRQRYAAEEQSLLEQLQRLRRSGDAATRDGFESLRSTIAASGEEHATLLDEEVAAMKSRVEEKLRGTSASPSSVLRAASSTAHMHAEELLHVLQRTLLEEATRQQSVTQSRQRCDELRSGVVQKIRVDVVERLQQARSVQHAGQSRIDAQRRTWEAAHRQNLAAACSLLLPVSGASAGVADAQYATETYAAPQDIVSIALLDVMRDKLRSRDDARGDLLRARKECVARAFRLLSDVRAHQESVHSTCDDLWTALQTQLAQQSASHEAHTEVEKALVTVAAQHQAVERDRSRAERERRRLAEVMQRLHAEAAQCGVDARLLSAPPELLEAGFGTSAPVVAPPFFRSVDPNAVQRLPAANKFTAVHASTNVAASSCAAETPVQVMAGAGVPATPPRNESTNAAAPNEEERGAAAPSPTSKDDLFTTVDASNATGTQPWSSTLLKAEQQLLLAASLKSGGAVVAAAADADASLSKHASSTRSSRDGHRNSSQRYHPAEGEGSASHSTTAEDKRHSSSAARSSDVPSPQGDSLIWLDTDTALQPRRQVSSSSSLQARGAAGRGQGPALQTWSTLDEYRSSIDRSAVTLRERDAVGDATTASLDDSTNFVDLLSCTDSPASSYRTY